MYILYLHIYVRFRYYVLNNVYTFTAVIFNCNIFPLFAAGRILETAPNRTGKRGNKLLNQPVLQCPYLCTRPVQGTVGGYGQSHQECD